MSFLGPVCTKNGLIERWPIAPAVPRIHCSGGNEQMSPQWVGYIWVPTIGWCDSGFVDNICVCAGSSASWKAPLLARFAIMVPDDLSSFYVTLDALSAILLVGFLSSNQRRWAQRLCASRDARGLEQCAAAQRKEEEVQLDG